MSTTQIADAITTASTISSSSSSTTSTVSNISVDSETFLTLLVAQMQYQDPLDPQTDTEFVTQLAQMSTLEEMQAISSEMSSIQAYSLVGQYAYAEITDSDTGMTSYIYGTIDSVVNESGTYYAVVDENVFEVDDIVQIIDPSLLETDMAMVDSSNLIGKIITGQYESQDGTTSVVTGVVTGVTYNDGVVYAIVDGVNIAVDSITGISEQTESEETVTEETVTEETVTEETVTEETVTE